MECEATCVAEYGRTAARGGEAECFRLAPHNRPAADGEDKRGFEAASRPAKADAAGYRKPGAQHHEGGSAPQVRGGGRGRLLLRNPPGGPVQSKRLLPARFGGGGASSYPDGDTYTGGAGPAADCAHLR